MWQNRKRAQKPYDVNKKGSEAAVIWLNWRERCWLEFRPSPWWRHGRNWNMELAAWAQRGTRTHRVRAHGAGYRLAFLRWPTAGLELWGSGLHVPPGSFEKRLHRRGPWQHWGLCGAVAQWKPTLRVQFLKNGFIVGHADTSRLMSSFMES